MAIAGARVRIRVSAGDVPGRDDFSGTRKLLVIHIDTVIDNGNSGAVALTQRPGGFHVGMGIDDIAVDVARLRCHCSGNALRFPISCTSSG